MIKHCITCRLKADYEQVSKSGRKIHYFECEIPRPRYASLYQTPGPLLIAREPFEDPENPIHHSTLHDCPTWEPRD